MEFRFEDLVRWGLNPPMDWQKHEGLDRIFDVKAMQRCR